MIGEGNRLGSAQVRWNDYVGTAAADDAGALLNRRSLYEIAGLDRDRWAIVGIEFGMGPVDRVVLYAADRTDAPPAGVEGDEVPVTAFHLQSSVRLQEFVRDAFKSVSVRLLSSTLGDRPLLVVGQARLADGPE